MWHFYMTVAIYYRLLLCLYEEKPGFGKNGSSRAVIETELGMCIPGHVSYSLVCHISYTVCLINNISSFFHFSSAEKAEFRPDSLHILLLVFLLLYFKIPWIFLYRETISANMYFEILLRQLPILYRVWKNLQIQNSGRWCCACCLSQCQFKWARYYITRYNAELLLFAGSNSYCLSKLQIC